MAYLVLKLAFFCLVSAKGNQNMEDIQNKPSKKNDLFRNIVWTEFKNKSTILFTTFDPEGLFLINETKIDVQSITEIKIRGRNWNPHQ